MFRFITKKNQNFSTLIYYLRPHLFENFCFFTKNKRDERKNNVQFFFIFSYFELKIENL